MQNQKPKDEEITIEAEFPIGLSIVIKILQKSREECDITQFLREIPKNKEMGGKVLEWLKNHIKLNKIKIEIKKMKYFYSDSENSTHGVAFFKVELEGTEKELKKVAGEDKLFHYDWAEEKK